MNWITGTSMPAALEARNGLPPQWWSSAGLGIFVHWGPYSVPGFAPTGLAMPEAIAAKRANPMAESPYAEWYENSLRFPNSSVDSFHRALYGDRPYRDFGADFINGCDRWDPERWADAFAATGAGYVVMVTKHHDGFCLWPSEVENPNRSDWRSPRDLVGELASAVRARGMRFGIYYSGGYDWTFNDHPIGTPVDALAAIPRGGYAAYATAQVRELIQRYRPDVLWNDIMWPGRVSSLFALLDEYFEAVPEGCVNDRWMTAPDLSRLLAVPGVKPAGNALLRRAMKRSGTIPPKPRFFQFRTPEYLADPPDIAEPWEMCRGIDHSFGFNRGSGPGDLLSRDDLLASVEGCLSAGGNVLLNVGPRGSDATIPDEQLLRLEWLAEEHGA